MPADGEGILVSHNRAPILNVITMSLSAVLNHDFLNSATSLQGN